MNEYCEICGRPAQCTHHLIFGWSLRQLADDDSLTINLCNQCHNIGNDSIHNNTAAEHLSKMLGQALWEKNLIVDEMAKVTGKEFSSYLEEEARKGFRERYGKSWL